jgi:hypothetical protein
MSNLEHAKRNADGHADTILGLYRAYTALEDGEESTCANGNHYTASDAVREAAMEEALSVEVRSGWLCPGNDMAKAEEFRILLTTGGPALQIVGELGEYGEANATQSQFEIQDWGVKWTTYWPKITEDDDWDAAFEWFLSCFYFGE